MRRLAAKLDLVIILMLAISVSLFIVPMFTGFLIYSSWSNELTAYNETNITGTNNSQGFWKTKTYNSLTEQMKESSDRLQWIFDFNTTYNVTSPTELVIKAYGVSFAESANITIYNHDTGGWDNVAQTTIATFPSYTNSTTNLNWSNRNLSNYINQTTGFVKIGFEDINSANGAQDTLYIDYLALNATFSPLTDEQFVVGNSSGRTYFSQANYTRYNYTRAAALEIGTEWNASNVTYGTVIINASGNVSWWYLGNISQNWTYSMLNLSNTTVFPVGGNITVSFSANDSYYQYNTSHIMAYFGLFGGASASEIRANESSNKTALGYPITIYCRVVDNESAAGVPDNNVSFYNNSMLFGHALTNSTGWAGAVYNKPSPAQVNNISCNVTDEPGIWYLRGKANNQTLELNVTADTDKPIVTSLALDSAGANSSYRTNLYMNASLLVNATDSTTSVTSAVASVGYPIGGVVNISMHGYGGGWRYVFANNETGVALNQTGNYTLNITAVDQAGNANHSWNLTFNVTNNYSVALGGYSNGIVYNRGENLTFEVRDANGALVSGANITSNLTYPTNTVSSWYSAANSTYMLWINGSFNVTNYTIKFFVNKSMGGNNTGYGEFRFNVTNALSLNRADSLKPSPGQRIGSTGRDTRFYINASRGARFPYTVDSNITCEDNSNYTLTKAGEAYYNETGCLAPSSYSAAFYVKMNVTDTTNNNTGTAVLSFSTSSAPSGPGGGDGGGGGGGGTVTEKCDCEWIGNNCGAGGCGPLEIFQTYNCTPAGCGNTTTRCQPSPAFCELNRRGFNFTADRSYVEIERGGNSTIIGTVSNTGNVALDINLTVQNNCCEIYAGKSFRLQNLSSLDIPVLVHTKILEQIGEYLITLTLNESAGLSAERAVSVKVVENPILADLEKYKAELERIRSDIGNYSGSGIDVTGVEALASQIEGSISQASMSASADSLAELETQMGLAKAKLEQARAQLDSLGLWKFVLDYKWWIALGIILAFAALYMATEILVPYCRLSREIKRMADKEKGQVQGRIATEKQYFTGKIDEKAFEEILIGKQSEILDTKGAIRHKMQERNELVRNKLSPKAVKDWVISGFGLSGVVRNVIIRIRKK